MTTEVLLAALGLATLLTRWGYQRWRTSDAIERELLASAAIQDELAACAHDVGGARIAVLAAHNGGSIPDVGDPMYSSARYEHVCGDVPSLLDVWRDRSLDAMSRTLLRRIVVSRHVVVRLCDLPPGQLRNEYGAHGVKIGVSVRIERQRQWWRRLMDGPQRSWHWLCCDWATDDEPTEPQVARIEMCAANVSTIMRRGRP